MVMLIANYRFNEISHYIIHYFYPEGLFLDKLTFREPVYSFDVWREGGERLLGRMPLSPSPPPPPPPLLILTKHSFLTY